MGLVGSGGRDFQAVFAGGCFELDGMATDAAVFDKGLRLFQGLNLHLNHFPAVGAAHLEGL